MDTERRIERRLMVWYLVMLLVGLGGWLTFAFTSGPELIVDAYKGQSHPLLNRVITGQDVHPVEHYLDAWQKLTWLGAAALVGLWGMAHVMLWFTRDSFFNRWVQPATPGTLGAMRFLVCAILLTSAVWEDLPSSSYLPREQLRAEPMGVVAWLSHWWPSEFEMFVSSHAALATFKMVTIALLAMAGCGLLTRATVPLAAVCYLIFAGVLRGYAWFYHTGLVPLYLLMLLSLFPCGHGFSLDRMIRRALGRPVVDPDRHEAIYGWGRMAVWAGIALPYVAAGASKLRASGLGWIHPDNMKEILLRDTVQPMQFEHDVSLRLLDGPDWMFSVLGFFGIFGELLFGLVLVSRVARFVFPAATAGMHVGILYLQNILFFDLIAIQLVYYDWRGLRKWIYRRLTRGAVRLYGQRDALTDRVNKPLKHRRATHVYGAGILMMFSVVLGYCWWNHVEYYPLTSMGMYRHTWTQPSFVWTQPLAHYEDGTVQRARFEQWIGAMADARYRHILPMPFYGPEQQQLADQFLEACLKRANAQLPPGRRVVRFELQRIEWHYLTDPKNPDYGQIVDRYFYPEPPPGPLE